MILMLDKIQHFYLLEEMYTLAKENCSMYDPRQGRYLSDLHTYRTEHNENLSLMLRDYLTLACIGEGRHGEQKCHNPFVLMLNEKKRLFGIRDRENRNVCYEKVIKLAPQIDPRLTLAYLLSHFKGSRWTGGYGGQRWGDITTTTLLHYDMPKEVFIDTVINLQHNTSTCLDKINPLFFTNVNEIQDFLDCRAKTQFSFFSPQDTKKVASIHIPYSLACLLDRGVGMGLFEQNENKWLRHERVRDGESYTPLTWGEGVITCKEVRQR